MEGTGVSMNHIWTSESAHGRSYFRSLRIGLALLAILVSPFISTAQNVAQTPKRLTIGVALEGGGALGLAHIGVLRWFEQHHIPIDDVAGTSMGGLVGGMYATGKSPDELDTNRQRNGLAGTHCGRNPLRRPRLSPQGGCSAKFKTAWPLVSNTGPHSHPD